MFAADPYLRKTGQYELFISLMIENNLQSAALEITISGQPVINFVKLCSFAETCWGCVGEKLSDLPIYKV